MQKINSGTNSQLLEFAETAQIFSELKSHGYLTKIVESLVQIKKDFDLHNIKSALNSHTLIKEHIKLIFSTLGIFDDFHNFLKLIKLFYKILILPRISKKLMNKNYAKITCLRQRFG